MIYVIKHCKKTDCNTGEFRGKSNVHKSTNRCQRPENSTLPFFSTFICSLNAGVVSLPHNFVVEKVKRPIDEVQKQRRDQRQLLRHRVSIMGVAPAQEHQRVSVVDVALHRRRVRRLRAPTAALWEGGLLLDVDWPRGALLVAVNLDADGDLG